MPNVIQKTRRRQLPSSDQSSSDSENSEWESDYSSSFEESDVSTVLDSEYSKKTADFVNLFKEINHLLKQKEALSREDKKNDSSRRSPKSKKKYSSRDKLIRENSGSDTSEETSNIKKRKYDKKKFRENSSKSSDSQYSSRKKTKRLKISRPDDESEPEISSSEDDDYVEEDNMTPEEYYKALSVEEEMPKSQFKSFNISLNLGEESGGEYGHSRYPKEASKDEECNSEDEATFMREKYMKVETIENGSANEKKNDNREEDKTQNIEAEYLELLELKKSFTEQLKKKPKNKILQKSVNECNSDIRNLIKNARHTNTKLYHALVFQEEMENKNSHGAEMDYFKKKLSNMEQLRIMQELKEINKHMYIDKPYRLSILQCNMPPKYKAIAIQKLNTMASMDPGDNEYFKIKNWIDAFMRIPFGITKNLNISINDGIDRCHDFIENAKQTLDTCVYGLNDAKVQIMQMIGQWLVNPTALGTSIAIHGPPGTGKTSIVKDGISKILGREFAFIALGGGGDSSFLEGHSYTYEGSTWGKIAQILMDSKCMNPVIYFDELDKVSDTARGQEIIGILTHLTDTTQNSQFHDKYFSEISFDISKCLFIFSYNDENMVNPILRDRLYRIRTKGYDAKDKLTIAKKYLLPKIREQVAFKEDEIIIPDDTINYIINSQHLTQGESGVRNLKRCLEIIFTKLNLFRVVKQDNNLLDSFIDMKVSFPYTVSRKDLDILIKKDEQVNQTLLSMYI